MRFSDFKIHTLTGLRRYASDRRDERPHRHRTTNLLIGYVLSLSLLVALSNLPLDIGDGLRGPFRKLGSIDTLTEAPLAIITTQEIRTRNVHARPRERRDYVQELPPADMEFAPLEIGESEREPLSPASILKPAVDRVPSWVEIKDALLLREIVGAQTPPRIRTSSIEINYPASAINRGVEGRVIAKFTVKINGRASGIRIVEGIDPACDREVVHAIRRAEFSPSRDYGQPVVSTSQLVVHFVLRN